MSAISSVLNYKLTTTLGEGTFGKVKLGEHAQTGKKVAVKILNKEKVKSMKMDEKIRREIQIMKLFNHPHIIKLYEVVETDEDILLIMEYVSGGELFDYIVDNGKMPEDRARRFFQQIISAVEYCHKNMIVHRDLKPENLLLDKTTDSVKITDFGLSNVIELGSFLKTCCGSPNYAAPEVLSGGLYTGPEVDIWSCGVVLYVLVCAAMPFDSDHTPTLFQSIRSGVYDEPVDVSVECRDLIRRLLTVDPTQRITIKQIREHPWFKIDLPPYLARTSSDVRARGAVTSVDPIVVAELQASLGARTVSVVEIEQAVRRGASEDGSVDPLAVAYHLIYDQKYGGSDLRKSSSDGKSTATAALAAAALAAVVPPSATAHSIPAPTPPTPLKPLEPPSIVITSSDGGTMAPGMHVETVRIVSTASVSVPAPPLLPAIPVTTATATATTTAPISLSSAATKASSSSSSPSSSSSSSLSSSSHSVGAAPMSVADIPAKLAAPASPTETESTARLIILFGTIGLGLLAGFLYFRQRVAKELN